MKSRMLWYAGLILMFASPLWAVPVVGDKAPAIDVGRWTNLPEGLSTLSDVELRGRIVMVEFWATWCGPCKAGIPHLIEMQKQYESKGVVLLALTDESAAKAAAFVTQNKLPYIVGSEATTTMDEFGIRGLPTMCLIDPDGKIAWKGHPSDAEPEVEKLLKAKPPKVKSRLGGGTTGTAKKAIGAAPKFGNSQASVSDSALKTCESWLAAARALVKSGKHLEAAQYYRRVIAEYPQSSHAATAKTELAKLET